VTQRHGPISLARVLAGGPIAMHRLPGSTIGPYVVEAELGRGAFGVVVRARPQAGGDPVAIKVLIAGADATASQKKRFAREAVLSEAIVHPNVVRVLDGGEEGHVLWLAMELVLGRTLKKVFEEGPPVAEVTRLVLGVAAGLGAAHARAVVHRDLKPENVLVRATDGAALLTDFGLARHIDSGSSLTKTGGLLGTPAYMAPEQIKGKPATPATDVFALGAMLYEGLARKAPFASHLPLRYAEILAKPPPPPSTLRPDVSPALDEVALRALAARPEDRYPDARAFHDALAMACAPDTRTASAVRSGGRGRRRARTLLLAAGAALALGAVGLAVLVASRSGDPPAVTTPSPPTATTGPDAPPAAEALWASAIDPARTLAERRGHLRELLALRPGDAKALALWDQVRTWERVTPPASPRGRDGAARLVWDPRRAALLLFGGWDGAELFNDLWAWDGAAWTALATEPDATRPRARHGHSMAWDQGRGRLLLHGGLINDTGMDITPETWTWDGQVWAPVPLFAGPEGRCWHGLEWEPDRDVVVLHCGRVYGPADRRYLPQDDLWEFDGVGWEARVMEGERPTPRYAFGSVWDQARRRLVVFGGWSEGGMLGDLWSWTSGGGWRQLQPKAEGGGPAPRHAPGMVMDGRGRAVLFGGWGDAMFDDTWLLDPATETWTRASPAGTPGARAWHAMGYDPVRRCVVVFGGQTPDHARQGDLWILPDLP
jgi:serine/threonine-protein kinase